MVTRFFIICAVLIAIAVSAVAWLTQIGGEPRSGTRVPLSHEDERLRTSLEDSVRMMSFDIGARNPGRAGTLQKTADHIEHELRSNGLEFTSSEQLVRGQPARTIVWESKGKVAPLEVALFVAHYDTHLSSPGANGNATGVAALLEVAKALRDVELPRTVRFVFFPLSQRPYRDTEDWSALKYARTVQSGGEEVYAVVSVDSVGHFSDAAGSETLPIPLRYCYPDKGNFLAFMGGPGDRAFVETAVANWKLGSPIPALGCAMPSWFPGVFRSDHEPFADAGFPALVITDTGRFRHRDHGTKHDLHTAVDYVSLVGVVKGLDALVRKLGQIGA